MQLIECAKAAGVTPDTLRHYLRVGLVVPDGRGTNGYRAFRIEASPGFVSYAMHWPSASRSRTLQSLSR